MECSFRPARITLAAAACRSGLCLAAGLAAALAAAGCDRSAVLHSDAGVPLDLAIAGPCDDLHPCPTGGRCYLGMCIPDNGTCAFDHDCENDTYCDCNQSGDLGCAGSICIPWGTGSRGPSDPMCHGSGFPASDFRAPVETCHWTLPQGKSSPIIMTPLVVDLDLDKKPEIVFSNFTFSNTAGLFAIHGEDCSTYWMHPNWNIVDCSELAAAHLDDDKFPQLVGIVSEGVRDPRVAVFNHLGALLAKSPIPYLVDFQGGDCSGPAIADVDGDGVPEILVSGQVLRYHKGDPMLEVLWNKAPSTGMTAHWGTLSLFADMDGDGRPEAVTGLKVYDGLTGKDKTPPSMGALGNVGAYPQVADFNGDKKPDILLVQSQPGMQQVSIVDYANDKIIFGPYKVVGSVDRPGGWGGPATVADFDGDGVPDFGLSSDRRYYVYAMKCALAQKPADCKGSDPGVLWERVTQDVTSGGTASSVFDFNGDGKAEVVYRDECWMRVMNGPDGKTVFAQAITSGTALEMPVVVDINGDGHADLVVPSDSSSPCNGVAEGQTGQQHTGTTEGIFVLRDPLNRWMSSRALWNQHTYHITNINENLTVPRDEPANWLDWNNYRQNAQGHAGNAAPLPDFTGGVVTAVDNGGKDCKVSQRLWANLCNRGAATAAPGVPGAFYASDPRQVVSAPLCVTQTLMSLAPGTCETVECDWPNPPNGASNIWFRADDDGTKTSKAIECDSGNDILYLPGTQCFIPG